jgi:hypothetical protein
MPSDPVQFCVFTAVMFLSGILGTVLLNVLLGSEDEDMRRQTTYNAEDYDGWQMLSLRRRFIGPVLSIAFFVFLFWIGMRHY